MSNEETPYVGTDSELWQEQKEEKYIHGRSDGIVPHTAYLLCQSL
jgi:hypothetical protein